MTDRKTHLDAVAVVSLVVCCFLWGLNQVAAKVAIAEVPPLWQAAVRSLGGAVLVFLWARLRGIAKVLSESPWGPSVVHRAGWDIGIAPFAHASGTLAGLACALGAWVLGSRIRPP